MTRDNDEFRAGLVAAVQAELDRHASAVVRELEAVRRDAERDRADFLSVVSEQVGRLAAAAGANDDSSVEVARGRSRRPRRSTDQHADDLEQRLLERVEQVRAEVTASIDAGLAQANRQVTREVFEPFASEIRREIAALTDRLAALDARLADFDSQAARMVTYVSETTTRLDRRHDDLVARVEGEVAGRLEMLVAGLDEQSETLRSVRSDTEDRLDAVGASISRVDERLVAVDERFGMLDGRLGGVDERIDLADGRLEAVGASIGRVDERLVAVDERLVAVDERFGMLDGRLGGVDDRIDLADGRFVDVEAQLVAHGERVGTIDERLLESERRTRSVADAVAQIDLEAIDTMKDKLSAAAGEAMLVRIEMERFEKTIGERSDQLAVRLTEVETTLQDTTLDVAASVQLDRLEEIERALAELDPDQFVRRDGLPTDPTATAPSLDDATSGTEVGDPESLTLASAESILKGDEPRLPGRPTPVGSDADRSDIDAIIAAAEAVNEREV